MSDLEDLMLSEPRYDIAQAAQYIRVSVSTLRAWVCGHDRVPPVLAVPTRGYLSFINLTEAFELHTMLRRYMIALRQVAEAIATSSMLSKWSTRWRSKNSRRTASIFS